MEFYIFKGTMIMMFVVDISKLIPFIVALQIIPHTYFYHLNSCGRWTTSKFIVGYNLIKVTTS